jgi:dinuclear metal center YbgI/SA1388 family protein
MRERVPPYFCTMLITDFLRALDQIVPLAAAGYERDAIGLQVGLARDTELKATLFAYEVTQDVIAEAKERGANLIIAFHPLIFPTIAAVTDATRTGALIRELVKSDIALYILHTAFDTHPEFGTSRLMAEAIGLSDIQILKPVTNPALLGGKSYGMGAIGKLKKPLSVKALLELASTRFQTPVLRHNEHGPKEINIVAVLGGAGMDYYSDARKVGADAFITADVRYHEFYRADHDGILLIDAGHAETERFVVKGTIRAGELAWAHAANLLNLQEEIPASRLFAARTEPNSVRYFQTR